MLIILLLLLFNLINIQYSNSIIIYVNSNLNNTITNCGLTEQTACPNIASGFDNANTNDIIQLQPGIYTGIGNENLEPQNTTKYNIILSGNGLPETIQIICKNENRFLHSENRLISRIENISIHNCTALVTTIRNFGDGGALSFNTGESVTISNCIFVGNRARSGGAIIILSGSLSINSCIFKDNQAGYRGGSIASVRSGLTITNSIFIHNTVDGGLIVDPALQLDTTEAGRGGSVHANGGARMTVRNSTFISNTAQIAGGAVYAKIVSGLEISNCFFQKNVVFGGGLCDSENACDVRGGALYVNDVALTLTNTSFIENSATTQDLSQFAEGGAVVFSSDTFSTNRISSYVTNCTFINNTAKGLEDNNAGGYGGAIYTSSVPLYLESSTFIMNHVISQGSFTEYTSSGGAIYIASITTGYVKSCYFKGNVANSGKGGAIYLTESSIMTIINNTFIQNFAYSSFVFKAQGGAIAIGHSSFGDIEYNTFQMNMALPKYGVYPLTYSGSGGAIFFQSSNGNITNCLFMSNVVVSGQFDSGAVGGAIAAENSDNTQIHYSTFLFNSARGYFGSNAYSNSGSGGAVISLFSSMTFRDCLFRGNWVSAGGSQYSIGGGIAIFYDYVPTHSGFPVFNEYPIIIDSCEFIDNIAGGEVCTITSSPLYRAGQGGAIGIIGFSVGNVEISNSIFRSNMALTDSQGIVTSFGGAIMYTLGSHLVCEKCTFINNIAWNGLGDDICSGYDDNENFPMELTISNSYLDAATNFEAFREHQRLVILVETLCWIITNNDNVNNNVNNNDDNEFYKVMEIALKITYQDRVDDYLPLSASLLSKTLQQLFYDRYEIKYNFLINNQDSENDQKVFESEQNSVFTSEENILESYFNENRRHLQLNKRIYPNILVMSGSSSIYQPKLNSSYEICAGDIITLIIRSSQNSFSGSIKEVKRKPQLTLIGTLTDANLIIIGISANITIIDQLAKQSVNLASLFMLNTTLHFSNNMTIVGSSVILGSVLTSFVSPYTTNFTDPTDIKSLNIQGILKTGFSESESIPNDNILQQLLSKSKYYPITVVRNCVLRIYGKLQVASIISNVSIPAIIELQNSSSIVIAPEGNLSSSCPVIVQTTDPEKTSIINNGIIDLSPRLNPSYLTPMTIEGYYVQSPVGKLRVGISNYNYTIPSFLTITNQTILGEIQMFAVEGTVYIPSSDSKDPTSWSIFQFDYTVPRSDGLSPIYRFPEGTNFQLTQSVDNFDDNLQNIQTTIKSSDISFVQEFTTSQLSCSYRSSDYKVSSDIEGDDDYMCYVCLKNHSCGYCGSSYGGCVDPGNSCSNGVFKKTDGNCCPHMCRGRGNCIAQNNRKTSFKCECIIFYQGVSCNNLSVFTYLLITAAVFILLIGLITVRYYYFSRQQKAKVLQELRAGLLTGSADDHGAENRSYIQAIQQDLILRDVFVNYEDISFEGKIGEGSFGEVFKATFRGAQVAVKQMRAPVFMQLSDRDIEEFRSEAYMMSRLRHPNIVLVMGISIVSFPKPAPPPGFDDDDMVMGGNKDSSVDRPRSISRDRKGKDKDKEDNMIRSICIITEYLEQGSLADILYGSNRVADEFWTYELVLTCALQAARGMLYLHSHQPPICHRDLKSSNLVVDDHWVVKVTDFGMSRIVPEKMQDMEKGVEGTENRNSDKSNNNNKSKEDNIKNKNEETKEENGNHDNNNNNGEGEGEEDNDNNDNDNNNGKEKKKKVNFNEEANVSWERESIINPEDSIERHSNIMMTSNLGTTAWCAPELLTSTIKARYSVKVDVYSYGMVLWELWERKRPYEELYSRFDIIDAVREGRRPAISTNCPPAYRSLIQRCWHDQPARRPTFAYIVRYIKDELAHVKRQRATSVSAQIFSPFQQLMTSGRVNSDNHLLDSNEYPIQEKPQVEKQPEKKTSNWKFISPIAAFANLTNQNDPEKQSTRPSSPVGRESESAVSAPTVIQSRKDPSDRDDEMTSRSTFSHPPRISSIRSTPLTVPQKPTQQNLDVLASSPWTSNEFPEESTTRNSSAWRDKYVLKFSGWNQSKPDTGLPPSLAPRPLSSSVVPPVPQERHIDRMESDSQDDSSDETVSNKESSFVDAKGSNGEPLPAEIAVELDTYSSSNSVV